MTQEYQDFSPRSNLFVISEYVDFDEKGRALCPCCAPGHKNNSKTLSLVPGTDGAYKCFRGCTSEDIREALGQPKPSIIPTALAQSKPKKDYTVDKQRLADIGLLTGQITKSQAKKAIEWLHDRGITTELISRHKLGLTRARVGEDMAYAVTIPIPDGGGRYHLVKRVAPWDKSIEKQEGYKPWVRSGISSMVFFTHKPVAARETWLCEGEWDAFLLGQLVQQQRDDVAVACFTCGCSSVPPKDELERLPGTVTIFYDRNDKPDKYGKIPGDESAKKVALALGDRGKIGLVPMPANCKVKGWDVSDAINNGFILESFERAVTEASVVLEEYVNEFEKGLRSLSDLFDTAPDYVDWLVPDLLTANELYCLAAEPRAGKSLFALGLAKAVASGGKFLDRPCQQGQVLYVVKEDPDDKVKERLIAQGWTREEMNNVTVHNDFTLLDIAALTEYVKRKQPALIIIDTLSRVNPMASCENSSEIVDVLAPLQNLAQQNEVCVLVVHHTRKKTQVQTDILDIFDSVRGSGAIRATCRGMLVLCKAKDNYRLAVENGRTAVQDLKVHLNLSNLTWMLNGLWSPPNVDLSKKDIVETWIKMHRQGTVKDIANSTLINNQTVHKILERLIADKKIKKIGKRNKAMYYTDEFRQFRHDEILSKQPTLDTEGADRCFDKNSVDPPPRSESEQNCKEVLTSDHFDHNSVGIDKVVETITNNGENTVVNIVSPIRQGFDKDSTVETVESFTINRICSLENDNALNNCNTQNHDQKPSKIVDIATFNDLKAIEDTIRGVYHKTYGYMKFQRISGKRIYGVRSGEQNEQFFYWNGCTGKVELKE